MGVTHTHRPPNSPGKCCRPGRGKPVRGSYRSGERKEGDSAERRDRSASRDGRSDSAKPGERKDSDGKRSVSPGPQGNTQQG